MATLPSAVIGFLDLGRVNVLTVDDSASTQKLLTEVLRGFGVRRVHRAATRAAALGVLRTCAIDVILVDIMLEGEDGLDLVRDVRASPSPAIASTPILIVSSHATAPRVIEAGAAGANGFLSKPFAVGMLAKRLGDALSAAAHLRSRSERHPAGPPAVARSRDYQIEV